MGATIFLGPWSSAARDRPRNERGSRTSTAKRVSPTHTYRSFATSSDLTSYARFPRRSESTSGRTRTASTSTCRPSSWQDQRPSDWLRFKRYVLPSMVTSYCMGKNSLVLRRLSARYRKASDRLAPFHFEGSSVEPELPAPGTLPPPAESAPNATNMPAETAATSALLESGG